MRRVREEMLAGLLIELERTRRRRHARRRAAASAVMVALVAGGVLFSRIGGPGWSGPRSMVAARTIRAVIVATDAEAMRLHEVSTGAGARWWRVVESKDVSLARIEMLEDRALIEALADMGRPTGIVRSMGKVWLTRPVTDEQGPRGG